MALTLTKLCLPSFVLVGIILSSAILPTTSFDVGSVVTSDFFDGIKNKAAPDCVGQSFYTRDEFLNAVTQFNDFAQAGSDDDSKRMCKIEEDDKSNSYCDDINYPAYPCVSGKLYYGRGPLQLTWNYNYGECGKVVGFDGLQAPETVSQDPSVSFKCSLWFWMTNVHSVVNQGFGETIRKINSGECDGGNPAQVQSRVGYYQDYCSKFGVDSGQNLYC
ncbi:chitinase 4-like isoform X2 [Mangifera indica]|uniref:chitinase 4-like isoform X2 n=1 Tax=Mangifera indica TaxID=29780 RepID=UPI001CFA6A44|nr:chitinase 4-like isoform X2 [Mangifera indica]